MSPCQSGVLPHPSQVWAIGVEMLLPFSCLVPTEGDLQVVDCNSHSTALLIRRCCRKWGFVLKNPMQRAEGMSLCFIFLQKEIQGTIFVLTKQCISFRLCSGFGSPTASGRMRVTDTGEALPRTKQVCVLLFLFPPFLCQQPLQQSRPFTRFKLGYSALMLCKAPD